MPSASLSELLDLLDGGALLLLPNARAARELRVAFDARQRARGRAAWASPQVLSWTQWTNSLWSELVVMGAESRLLLNAAQEHSLWREIIAEDAANSSLAAEDSLAELARSAWQLAAGYEAVPRLRSFAASHDPRIFATWAETFSAQCAARSYLSAALLNRALLEHAQAGTFAAPRSLELVGFGEMQPSQIALLAGLRACGTEVVERGLEVVETDGRARISSIARNEREELMLAARWVREFLEEPSAREGGARGAVLLPDVGEDRAELEGVLRETLAPELQSIDADLSSTPWEFSGGVPLSSLAMVADALALVRWMQEPLPLERVSSLLLSPYMGGNGADGEERDARARFDVGRLRRALLLRAEIEFSSVLELVDLDARAARSEDDAGLRWVKRVNAFLGRSGDGNRPRGFSDWMEFVRGILQSANWPGNRVLTATEFEATRAWESVLDLVSTLDFSGRRVTFAHALQVLAFHVQAHLFAPPSTGASVQVMSIAEAEGSIFDAVVFLRCTDRNWPASERVHPLLPWTLQRSLKMPGSDPLHTAARCRALTEDLFRRSGRVLFTAAVEDKDGKLRPSPLLEEMGVEYVDAAQLVRGYRPATSIALELDVDDSRLPALPSHEVAGGSSVLKLQAACGFLAFAELRMRATAPESGDIGLDAGESGVMLHRALQYFWKKVATQDLLRSMSETERERVLTEAVDAAMPGRLLVRDGWDRAYVALLKRRMHLLLRQWLDQELQRGPFRVVDVERKELVTVGPLTLEVRVDRIDSVGEGMCLVDYKTGYDANPKQWSGPRPDDPQLPLYTLLAEAGELKGVAFAKVRAGHEMKWLGYQSEEGVLPASRSKANIRDIALLMDEWRETLTQLAEDFAAGRADVFPKSYEKNCARCAQKLLCRIDPGLLQATGDDVEEETEDADG
jgi:ATP-dependent helicase/nuclease subunit B